VETSSLLAATALFALPCALQALAALPMVNGTGPGGREVPADDGGPVYVNGRETRLKRFNDDHVEAHDPARGVTLSITTSAGGGVQMSHTGQGGANGGCSVGRHDARGGSHDARAGQPWEVTCESQGNTLAGCDMDTRGDVELVRRLSRTECVEGRNGGCRAVPSGSRTGAARCSATHRGMAGIRPTTASTAVAWRPWPPPVPGCWAPAIGVRAHPARWSRACR